MHQLTKQAKIIIGLLILVVVLGVILAIFQYLQFRIVKSTPDTNNYPSTMGILVLEFNEALDAASIQESYNKDPRSVVSFNFDSAAYIEVFDKTLKITIQETARAGNYTLSLANIKSQDGSIFTGKIPFIVKNIQYDDLDEQTQKLFDEYASEAETLPQDPIVKVLPYETDKFKISYTFPPEEVELPATITVTMKFFEPGDNALPATPAERQAYLNELRTYRNQALTYLQEKGIDINQYIMNYTEIDLRSEFPSGFVAQPKTP